MRVLALALVAAGGCHAFYQVRGTVQSCATRVPVSGATVDLHYPGERGVATTEADGTFQVAVNDPPGENLGTLTVTAPGHRAATRTVHHGDNVSVCLSPQ